MARRRNTTKHEIIQTAARLIFEVGYSSTTPKLICDELDLSTGNLTYYFPTKEHLLLLIVEMLCDFQWKMLEVEIDRGIGSAASICLETMTVAVACAESEIARDFFIATFQSELCRNYLRCNHVDRAKKIFVKQCEGWTDEQFHQAELLVMGLQYAVIVPNDADIPLQMSISGALNQILDIYNVDEESRQNEIEKVLAKDCRDISKRVLEGFEHYVERITEEIF